MHWGQWHRARSLAPIDFVRSLCERSPLPRRIAATALALALGATASPAWADGGVGGVGGGSSGGIGGTGGSSSGTPIGSSGGNASIAGGGGGGGGGAVNLTTMVAGAAGSGGSGAGGGASGGSGGFSSATVVTGSTLSVPVAGGVGGSGAGGGVGIILSGSGADSSGGGGGGGGQGADIQLGALGTVVSTAASINGGRGGAGGAGGSGAASGGGGGGGGGDGGIGLAVAGGQSLTIASTSNTLTGGAGGLGGGGGFSFSNTGFGGVGGAGGAGGVGTLLTNGGSISNNGSVSGGTGGVGGFGGFSFSIAGFGGDGGAGGAGGVGALLTHGGAISNSGDLSGGNGADGGAGGNASFGGNGGAGGAGGAGALVTNGGTISNSGMIVGGKGGDSGFGGSGSQAGCNSQGGSHDGGAGGVGVRLSNGGTIVNSGTIVGGNGGVAFICAMIVPASLGGGGSGGPPNPIRTFGSAGVGGAGIIGSNIAITNSGSISGGFSLGLGDFHADAIHFIGGTNTLTLSNANLSGVVEIDSGATATVIANAASLTLNNGFILNGAGIFDTNSNTMTVLGPTTGAGSLTKIGAGTLLIGGGPNYTGGTTVSAGTLQLLNVTFQQTGNVITVFGAGTLGSPSGSVTVSGGTLDLGGMAETQNGGLTMTGGTVQNGTLSSSSVFDVQAGSVAATLSGSGALTKSGGGTVILDGVNTYTGGTTVAAGTLEIGDAAHPGASVAGNVVVSNAALVMGHGGIGGNLSNTGGGTVMPGGSIGTMTVAGNYMQSATSTLAVEVSPTAASKLLVGGTASLAGILALTYDPGVYTGKSFTLVSAGSVSGTFTTLTTNALGLPQSLVYTATEVDLTAFGNVPVIAPTQDSVFGSLGASAMLGAQQANATVLGHLADQHDGSGTDTIKTSLAGTAPTRLAFNGSTQALASVVSALPDAMTRMGGWFRALGTFADLDSSASAPGFNSRAGGFMAGFDGPVADNLRLGVAGGYGHTELSASDSESGSIDTPRIALYGSSTIAGWSIDALAGYGYDMIHAQRPIAALGAVASSHHNGQEANAALQASKPFAFGNVVVQPAAGVTYTHLFENSFAETGAGAFDLTSPTRDTDSLRPFISASASQAFTTSSGMRIVPEADISYSYETMNTPPSLVQVGGGSFSVDDARPSRNELQIGGGVTMAMTNALALHVAYHAVLPTGNLFEQIVEAGASYRF